MDLGSAMDELGMSLGINQPWMDVVDGLEISHGWTSWLDLGISHG